jgi:DNA helicase II / ATP-dependent DNA helicase PcrA
LTNIVTPTITVPAEGFINPAMRLSSVLFPLPDLPMMTTATRAVAGPPQAHLCYNGSMDILEGLNPAQKLAVEAADGPLLILAGPGSGKTRVITHRIAYLVKVRGVSPHRIMAVTFTNKAAREMKERLSKLVSTALPDLTVGTFHAICARILRQDGRAIGVQPGFVIYDDQDQTSLIKRCLQALNIDPKQFAPASIGNAISAAKSQTLTAEQYTERGRSYFDEVVGRVYEQYQKLLDQSNALDFDDLLMKTVWLFRKNPDVMSRYQSRYLHLLVDEFQDTNTVQYEMIKQLGGKHRNVCVVGDPDQSIYSWRQADVRNILSFEKDYPEAKVILLEQNYRSTQKILETASKVIASNKQRKPTTLWTENEPGEPVSVIETYTEQDEAQFVVSEIEHLVEKDEVRLSDCAVMYRTNAQSRALEEAFIRYGTPYKLVAGTKFYERREIKDMMAYLRLIQNQNDNVSLLRIINVPQRGIGDTTQARLSSWADSAQLSIFETLRMATRAGEGREKIQAPFSPNINRTLMAFLSMIEELIEKSRQVNLVELLDSLFARTRYKDYLAAEPQGEDRWETVLELRTVAEEYREVPPPGGLSAFLETVALVSDVDTLDEATPSVTLITLHQAKGLEFPVVFIVGMEEGLLPHFRSLDDPTQMEEERRLAYVGITRAKKRVYLVRSFRRTLMGRSNATSPSRFLNEIPSHMVKTTSWWQGGPSAEVKIAEAVYSWNKPSAVLQNPPAPVKPAIEIKAGDHVRHAQFGAGVVVSVAAKGGDQEVTVAFSGTIKKLLMSFARLEKV